MAGMMRVEQGAVVPIALQLADGATDQYPQAEVRDDVGTLLATLDLAHQASGLYVPVSPYVMPAEIFVRVTYIVYENDYPPIGVESALYLRDADVFLRVADVTAADVWSEALPGSYGAGEAGRVLGDLDSVEAAVEKIRKVTTNRVVINATDTLVTVYEDDDVTPAFTFTISADRRERTP